ncbi:hypothetical protein D4Q76_01450 [archaeon]|nr:MAG: hypothetical protein D4Q76_01450 [archaeon]
MCRKRKDIGFANSIKSEKENLAQGSKYFRAMQTIPIGNRCDFASLKVFKYFINPLDRANLNVRNNIQICCFEEYEWFSCKKQG